MKIKIGLTEKDLHFENLLNQIGVDWDYLDFSNSLDYSLIVINSILTKNEIQIVNNYLKNTGSIFLNTTQNITEFNYSLSKCFVKTIFPNEINFNESIDFFSNIDLINNKIFNFIQPNICIFPQNLSILFSNTKSQRLNFYFNKDRLPNEIVNSVSKGSLTNLIKHIFKKLHFNKNLIFASKSLPSNIFTFRIDTDKSDLNTLINLYNLIDNYSISAIWFLDVSTHKNYLSEFQNFKNQFFGFHCFNHKNFKNETDFVKDFNEAKNILLKNNFLIDSASCTYGKWDFFKNNLFEKEKLLFSSEFSLSYDSLPFYPIINFNKSSVLQIPIHPICIGSLKIASYKKNDIFNYFKNTINKNISLKQPIMLYHHPLDNNLDVLEDIFKYLDDNNIKNISYHDYYNLWLNRENYKFEIDFNQNDNKINYIGNEIIEIEISKSESESIELNKIGEYSLYNMNFNKYLNYNAPSDINRIRDFDIRHLLQDFLFYINSK